MHRPRALFILDRDAYDAVYVPTAAAEVARRVTLAAEPQTKRSIAAHPHLLSDVDVIFSGWGAPTMDAAFLAAAPKLSAVFYGAGAINGWCTPAVWDRGVVVTTANDANAIPVAEFTVATALFALKAGFRLAADCGVPNRFQVRGDVPGNYRTTIGLVGMGTIARLVARLVAPFGMRVVTYDPHLSADAAAALGVVPVGLAELFAASDVVSLHAPELPSTRGMVTGQLVRSLRPGGVLINTSRGSLVREAELAAALRDRPDLHAVLDVTDREPLPATSPLHGLANLTLTPHLAGSQGRECQRMGQYMVDELDRYLAGRPLRHRVWPDRLTGSVHQLAAVAAAAAGELHPVPIPV